MKIKREIIGKIDGDYSLWIRQVYEKFGMEKAEYSFKQSESDFSDNLKRKKSSDNGKTWGNWQDLDKERFMTKGKAEKLKTSARTFFDYKNERIIKILMERIFPQGHHKDYENYSKKGVITWSDHVFLDISSDNGKTWEHQLVKFEDGPDMEPENWLSEAYLKTNHLYFGNRVEIEENGDIIFAVSVGAPALCNVFACELGTTSLGAALVFKGKWNEKTGRYDLTMSQPLFIDGAKSSRGLMEPNVLKLKSGKYLFECRGSNAKSAQKNALTTPDTPGYRWMALSNDGINWSEIKPMTYDTGEKFFSPSSISHIFVAQRMEKLIGLVI